MKDADRPAQTAGQPDHEKIRRGEVGAKTTPSATPDLALEQSTEAEGSRALRVLFISQKMDLAEIDLVLRLHCRGIFVRALTSAATTGREEMVEAGIFVESVPYRTKMSPRFIAQIVALVRAHGITIVHATDTRSLANAVWASYQCDFEIIGYRGTPSKIRRSDPGYRLGILHPRVAKIFCVNEATRKYLAHFVPAEKLVLNYKGFDVEWTAEADASPLPLGTVPTGALVAMHISNSRGRPNKGLKYLIDAFHLLDDPRAHLVVLGNHDADISVRAARGPAAARIHLLGEVDNASRFLGSADVYVHQSILDGLPRAVKEAMAQGIAPILSNIPSLAEMIVDGESGILAEPADPEALAAALRRLFADRELRLSLGANARRRLRERFSTEAFFETTLAVYRELASSQPRSRRFLRRGRR